MKDYPKTEEKILDFWEKKKIFEKCQKARENSPIFSFYDGPPFASGSPHYGHILASVLKDIVLRYFTMAGFKVPRLIGWDCHGLPVENLIEKKLNLKSKKDVLSIEKDAYSSIEKFNRLCRQSVFQCIDEWKETFRRIGRWVSYKEQYVTLDNNYIESVWWVFSQLYKKGLIYKDFKVTPYCPRCGTPLSNFEVNLGYRDTKETSIYLKFAIKNEPNTYFLVWTTTPWTLPANLALAVNPDAYYLKAYFDNEVYVFAENTAKNIFKNSPLEGRKPTKTQRILGKKLLGTNYQPLYPQKTKKKAYFVILGDFVSVEEGTGIVHIAPAFGEDDMNIGKKYNLDVLITVDESGRIRGNGLPGEKLFVKQADPEIIKDLEEKNVLFKKEKIVHAYPFCWRCDSPLLYYPIEAWYVNVLKIKEQLIQNNFSKPLKDANGREHKGIHWVPSHLKRGRFGKWLEGARDWAISRNRFWGAPLPIWECEKCSHIKVIGTKKELQKDIPDLHRPFIDKVFFKCEKCGGRMRRREEVFDCWFESGSMPYASFHYPFENRKKWKESFPADFIVEGLDQTRGWFYTLHVLATALFDSPAFKNVFVNGLILDAQGKKLSKKLKNYPEPQEIFDQYGADSLRYWLVAEVPPAGESSFSEKAVQDSFRNIVLTVENVVSFFELYIKSVSWEDNFSGLHVLDKWILSRLYCLEKNIRTFIQSYNLRLAMRQIGEFIQSLSLWYLRLSRGRLREDKNAQKVLAYTLVNFSKILAPFLPFLAEDVYQRVKKRCEGKVFSESVHLCNWPKIKRSYYFQEIIEEMSYAEEVVSLGRAARKEANLPNRQPLEAIIVNRKFSPSFQEIISQELNLKKVKTANVKEGKNLILKEGKNLKIALDILLTPQLREEGEVRQFIRLINGLRKEKNLTIEDKIVLDLFTEDKEFAHIASKYKDIICSKVLANQIEFKKSIDKRYFSKINIQDKDIFVRLNVQK